MTMTKAAEYRKWLAHRIWGGGDCCGWTTRGDRSKRDNVIIDRWIKDGHVDVDVTGVLRLTAAGRKNLDLPPIETE
jgi:hypothetical protein